MGVNFEPKNPVEVLHFHKIQVLLNILRIFTLKIRGREISRKHLVLDNKKKQEKKKKKKRYTIIPWLYELGLFKEVRHEISLAYQFQVTFKSSFCEFLLESGRHEISHN